jgi:GntR family transcriptional regulator
MVQKQVTRYLEIEKWLRAKCLKGSPGDSLPSEIELCSRFSVSRMTVRQALANLEQDGLVDRVRGSGTFIAARPMHRREGVLMSFTEDMVLRGLVPSSFLISARKAKATRADASSLGLREGDAVIRIERVRLADGLPIAIEVVALPASFADILDEDLESGSLHLFLRQRGRGPTDAWSWVTARLATAMEAKRLDLPKSSALLVERRVVLASDGIPIEHTETAYVSTRYVIDLGLQPAGLTGHSRAHKAAPTAPAEVPNSAGRTSKKARSTKGARS